MALDKLFRIDFYPHDWLVETGRLTLEQRGLFITIVALIYANRGAIAHDEGWIARAANCSPRLARKVIGELVQLDYLQLINDGNGAKVAQKRCEKELNIKRSQLENGSKGGRISAENRRDYNKNNDVASSQIQNELTASIPIPNPIPNPNNYPSPYGEGSGLAAFAASPPPSAAEKKIKPKFENVPDWDGDNHAEIPKSALIRLTPALKMPDDWFNYAERLGWPEGRIFDEFDKLKAWATIGKGHKHRRNIAGWNQTWINWIGKAAERGAHG